MGNYVKTILNFIRYHYLPHLCGAALLVLCAGAVLSFRNLDIAGPKGGLLVAPTHLLEPEVPWENIKAYIQACRDYPMS